ncbi:MbtH family NRPS accessory protein [Streptomyces sp. NPDC051162]|uniref:MbtH family NRPS accessory protein n=1 Tax=unclassified Streptomyces TaxID=2593676 RepID=UPI00342D9F03
MQNPFEDHGQSGHTHLVLKNTTGELSLWPVFLDVPDGWAVVLPANDHSACLTYLKRADAHPDA